MAAMKILFILCLYYTVVFCKVRFDNYTLFEIIPRDEEQVKSLLELGNEDGFDFWTEPSAPGKAVNVLVAPEKKHKLGLVLDNLRSSPKILNDNLQTLIDSERIGNYNRNASGMTFDAYYNLYDIYAWLDDLVAAHPNVLTKIIGGTTYEGRQIEGIKISHGSGRRGIFLEGGIHSREWITLATVNYITNELLHSDDEEIRAAARNYDWYIFPATNPDGYLYSHIENRMWRKNTRPVRNLHGLSLGVDLNRNWNANWMVAGTSDVPASESFGGLGPFSEIETRSLSSYIRSVADDLEMYLSFHSFSQLLLLPYGHSTEHLDNYRDVVTIGRRAMGSLAVRYNTQYVTGNIAEAIYLASGGSIDWVKSQLRVPIVLCYELRDQGQFGFLLPADQILPTGEETMDSVLALIREGRRLGYFA